jgi:hypothetical protein
MGVSDRVGDLARRDRCLGLIFFVVCMSAGQIFAVQNGNFRLEDQTLGLAFGAYMVVGALILARRPENTVGWVF